MSSCFGFRKRSTDDEQEPLLPRYEDDTVLQRRLHQKLHSYQMVRALARGYMPSNEQVIINLRTLLASDVLNPDTSELSDSGRLLVKYVKQWLRQFMQLLQHKNGEDRIQDFVWLLVQSRLVVDTEDMSSRVASVKARADSAAAYRSLQTVGSLLLSNSDFRIFLSDLQNIGRDVFKDSAFAISRAAEDAGKKLDELPPAIDLKDDTKAQSKAKENEDPGQGGPSNVPSQGDLSQERQTSTTVDDSSIQSPTNDQAPTRADLKGEVKQVSRIVGKETAVVAKETEQSLEERLFSGSEPKILLSRLQKTVANLRQHTDYSDSVSTLSTIFEKYAIVYSKAAEHVAETAQDDIRANEEMKQAGENFWSLVRSFGSENEWIELEHRFKKFAEHRQRNPEFESFMKQVSNALQELLTDPSFFDDFEGKINEIRRSFRQTSSDDSTLQADIQSLLDQIPRTLRIAAADSDIHSLFDTTVRIAQILSPTQRIVNRELAHDALHTFLPLLINAIQHVPIPRLEVIAPEVDLLLENLILEPGRTINRTSFLPFRFRAETFNAIDVRRTRQLRTAATTTSEITIKIDGLTLRAEELGYILRLHTGLLRFSDAGIASFALDERGVDIALDVQLSAPSSNLETVLSLKDVRVHVHKLNYSLRQSKLACLAWLLKPLLRPILKRTMERQLAQAIVDGVHAANREVVFARERLRATRIADPKDLATFFKAVLARFVPPEDPDVEVRVGVEEPGRGVFRGVYAPGSVVKLWKEEGVRAGRRVEEWERGGWRNEVFDVVTA